MRLEKYLEERFDGPWHIHGTMVETPTGFDLGHFDSGLEEAMNRYNDLLNFTIEMAKVFNQSNPQKFKEFYYDQKDNCQRT